MDKRLKIITIIIGVIFATNVITGFYHEFMPGFRAGFNEGFEYGRNQGMGAPVTRTFYLSLKAEEGRYTFPTTLPSTTRSLLAVSAEVERARVQVTYFREEVPIGVHVADGFAMVLAFFALFAIIFIPVQVFRIVRSITRSKVFEVVNVKRLRYIGYAILLIYGMGLVIYFLDYKIASHVVQIEGYLLQWTWWREMSLLLLGLVVLAFAEVLKISVRLKEEQDLTV